MARKVQIIPPGYTEVVHPETTASIVLEETDLHFVSDAEKEILAMNDLTVGTRKAGSVVGVNSSAIGFDNEASGDYSSAEGYNNVSTGGSSHAEGQNTSASGTSSHSEGASTGAVGAYSHAENRSTISASMSSHAEGRYSLADVGSAYKITAYDNVAKTITLDNVTGLSIGNILDIKVQESIALLGLTVTAINGLIVTLNTAETISDTWKYAIKGNGASYPAHAEGNNTLSAGNNSHAEGDSTVASGGYAHTEGYGTTASAVYTHAEGQNTIASAQGSHAEGGFTTASGMWSHAEGQTTFASGNNSHAEGQGTIASGVAQHVSGRYNVADTTSLFLVGNGTSDTDRSNAMKIDANGNGIFAGDVSTPNGNLGNLKNVRTYVTSGSTLTLTHKDELFIWIVGMQGSNGQAYASYILQGYGAGTAQRNHITQLSLGAGISVTISNNSFIISNTTGATVWVSILVLLSSLPTIS